MSQRVDPLNLYQWTEADPFRVSEVNSNFAILAAHADLKSSERATAQSSSVSWRVRKFYDGTVELYCRVPATLPCSTVIGNLYHSSPSTILFPANVINSIECIQLQASASNAIIMAVNQTSNTDNSGVTFRCISPIQNASPTYIDVLVKGVGTNV